VLLLLLLLLLTTNKNARARAIFIAPLALYLQLSGVICLVLLLICYKRHSCIAYTRCVGHDALGFDINVVEHLVDLLERRSPF
jgi:hypothetical protein